MRIKKYIYLFCIELFIVSFWTSQTYAQSPDLKLSDWHPESKLVVPETKIIKPRFPVIDFHTHLGYLPEHLNRAEQYLNEMDESGVWMSISLDGFSKDDYYKDHIDAYGKVSRERFLVFYRPNWENIDDPNFGENEARNLEESVKYGITGVKIIKYLGLSIKTKNGKVVPVDDPKLDPFWEKCGELGLPVVIHVADPDSFWDPVDSTNEMYEKLVLKPKYSFSGDQYPSKDEILEQRNRVIAKHSNTIFVGAHFGNSAENLYRVGIWMERYPNFYVDISARINQLGRQPYTARKFFITYQDRILFGSDSFPTAEELRFHYRVLETSDEYIDRNKGKKHKNERWYLYGLDLPDDVLAKVYYKNALKLLNMKN